MIETIIDLFMKIPELLTELIHFLSEIFAPLGIWGGFATLGVVAFIIHTIVKHLK